MEPLINEKPLTFACIPSYNEEWAIAVVVLGASRHAGKVIVCDDGSTDMTGEIAEQRNWENLFGDGRAEERVTGILRERFD